MACLQCGAATIREQRGGKQPGFCSRECRRVRKQYTYKLWLAANSAKVAAKHVEYRKLYREINPEYFVEFYQKNKERRRSESKHWYNENAARAIQRQKAYTVTHPEQTREAGRRSASKRRAIKARVFIESVDPQTVFSRDNGVCGICRRHVDASERWEIDHVIPISKGGAHSYANVQLAHRRCNRSKSAKVPNGQSRLCQVVV